LRNRTWPHIAAILVVATAPMWAAAQTGPLVTATWLEGRLADSRVRVVELGRTPEQFAAKHIPNAQLVDWRTDLVDPSAVEYFAVAPREAVEALLSRLGVTRDMTIVLYDSQSSRIAARMFWLLTYYGHPDVRILDGGANAWEAAGGAWSSARAIVEPTDYRVAATNDAVIAASQDVEAAIGSSGTAIIDARAPEFFLGESFGSQFGSDTPNAKAGHVPGARNFFWAGHFNADGTFKSVDALRAMYEAAGITPDRAVITYCHVGLQASTPWFVLSQLLAYPSVRLYDRSMAEWANLPETTTASGQN